VYTLFEAADGTLLIGTGAGLARLSGDEVTDLSRIAGLYNGSIYAIVEDDAGYLWISTPRGVYRVALEALMVLEGAPGERVDTMLYGTADGMASSECVGAGVSPAAWRTDDGRIWFPTARGVAMVDPAHLMLNRVPPRVVIERLVVDGHPLSPVPDLRLPANSRRFEFHFTAPSFRAPERVRFRYRLEGFDEDWMEAGGRRRANYTNLGPGSYRFRVTGANNDGVWAERPAEVIFDLEPRFYMTPWFALLLLSVVGLAGWIAYHQHRRGMEREFSAVLAERTRMAREIHDTLAQGFTGVSIQLEALEETLSDDPVVARRHLDRARGLVRESLGEARRSVLNLRPPLLDGGNLAKALSEALTGMTSDTPIEAEFAVTGRPRRLSPSVQDNLLRIGQEAVANALQHADPSRIRVELSYETFEVRLKISDDGAGFDPRAAAAAHPPRLGLVGMRERAEEMEGSVEVRSAPGQGTDLTVSVPVR
jgi:signal transduction histidine kinase